MKYARPTCYRNGKFWWWQVDVNLKKSLKGSTGIRVEQVESLVARQVALKKYHEINGSIQQIGQTPRLPGGSEALLKLLQTLKDECDSDRILSPIDAERVFEEL